METSTRVLYPTVALRALPKPCSCIQDPDQSVTQALRNKCSLDTMAGLRPAAQDRLFLLGIGLSACAAIALMRHMLIQYQHSAIVLQSESKPQYITQEVEDSLKLSTLDKLLDSPNYSIQETTAIIICERALHDGSTIDALLFCITRPHYATREQGIRAMSMMINSCKDASDHILSSTNRPVAYVATVTMICKPKTYAALVKCLEYSITDYEHNGYDPEWDNWYLRDIIEQGCLSILAQLVDKFGVEGIVKARFVERWLVKEPWGGGDADERQFNFMDSLTKHFRLNEICLPLFRNNVGKKALEDARLLPTGKIIFDESEVDVKMTNGEGTAGEDFEGMFIDSNRRRRDQSSEEEHLRRRHREAMVLNDGTRPLGRGDIIERDR